MEFWRQVAIDDLKRFRYLETSIDSMQEQIEIINSQISGSGYCMSASPVSGGASKLEDKYNNAIVLKDKLKHQISDNNKEYDLIKKTLDKLTHEERKILEYAYIDRSSKYIDRICEVFNIERTQAYRNINSALNHYVMVRYGV